MPSRDVNAATRLAEAGWRRDNNRNHFLQGYYVMTFAAVYPLQHKLMPIKQAIPIYYFGISLYDATSSHIPYSRPLLVYILNIYTPSVF